MSGGGAGAAVATCERGEAEVERRRGVHVACADRTADACMTRARKPTPHGAHRYGAGASDDHERRHATMTTTR